MNAKHCPPGTLLLASSKCPFCGKMPQSINYGGKISPRWFTRCLNIKCAVRPCTQGFKTKEEAEAAWCRRA